MSTDSTTTTPLEPSATSGLVYFQVWEIVCPRCQAELPHRALGWMPHPKVQLGVVQCMICKLKRNVSA